MILNENSTVLKYMYDYSSDVLGVKVKMILFIMKPLNWKMVYYWILIK